MRTHPHAAMRNVISTDPVYRSSVLPALNTGQTEEQTYFLCLGHKHQ
jgi:hypothetical protein